MEFLKSIKLVNTFEEIKYQILMVLKYPTLDNSKQLIILLNQFSNELKNQTNSEIWRALVPSSNSQKINELYIKLNGIIDKL